MEPEQIEHPIATAQVANEPKIEVNNHDPKFTALSAQQQLSKKLGDWIASNHQTFFNQEVEEIKNLSLDEVKARIERWSEAYFGAESEALKKKIKLQAASSVFNNKMTQLSLMEQEAIREEDVKWTKVHSQQLQSPLTKKVDKTKRLKKDLESGMKDLFGDKAAEAMKKLGL